MSGTDAVPDEGSPGAVEGNPGAVVEVEAPGAVVGAAGAVLVTLGTVVDVPGLLEVVDVPVLSS
ncbi:MAG: hypothetical protein ACRCU1_20545 [Alsobacter sp.]